MNQHKAKKPMAKRSMKNTKGGAVDYFMKRKSNPEPKQGPEIAFIT